MIESWRDIEGYEGLYKISNLGNVLSVRCGKLRKLSVNQYGYHQLWLSKNGVRKCHLAHQLVARAFIPNPNQQPQVNHRDLVKLNNSISNLEWCSTFQNNRHYHSIRLGRECLDVEMICINSGNAVGRFKGCREAGRKTGIQYINIMRCCNGQRKSAGGYRWRWLKDA